MNKDKKFKKNIVNEKWETRNEKREMKVELWIKKKSIFYWFVKIMYKN